jgi:ATP-dependent helicase HrpB
VLTPLPVDPFIPHVHDALKAARAVIVTAPPGAGKTTRLPPALVPDGPVIVLEPRRVAARALAQHVASERGWTIGREIGWHVRFERRFGPDTRLLVATEGILTARLQRDPLLADFRTIVLDEFHERSIHADLALALARQAWKARDDLRLVVMSATVDAESVAEFLDACPIVRVAARLHPLDISYAPQQSMAAAADELLAATTGDVLCFLPGAAEIQRTIAQMRPIVDARGIDVLPLHGSLGAAEQDAAVRGGAGRRRVIVATNVAETSLTVPGVTGVVDSGLCKVARYDADRAIDSLTTERISQDSADQRAGRAGRTTSGQVRRLWAKHDRLRPHTEPEIHRVDLSSVALDVMAWGGDPQSLEWFDAPPADALEAAIELLRRLDAVSGRQLTKLGRDIARLPLHPRLACMLHAATGARSVARVCALLSDRHVLPPRSAATTSSDLLSALDRWTEIPSHVDRVARQLEQLYESSSATASRRVRHDMSEADFRRAVLAGYPDRIAQRREAGSPRVRLATGGGAVLNAESGVRDGEFMAAVDVRAQPGDARIRIASLVEREWLTANAIELVHTFDAVSGIVRAAEVERYDALILRERPVPPEPDEAARLLTDAWLSRGADAEDEQLMRRVRFAGHDIDVAGAVRLAAYGHRVLADVKLSNGLPSDVLRTLDAAAPRTLSLPSGRAVRLEYLDDGRVKASTRLQDVFGLRDTPRLGPARAPVLFALLAPNGRPVQLTTDLRSFWERTYPEVRKELRGRYPRHRWPENPLGPASKAPAT